MRLTVRVQPGARRSEVGGRYGTSEPAVLMVRVTAPATDGRANDAVTRAIAGAFGVPRSSVRITNGHTSRTKFIEVDGGEPARLRQLLDNDG